MLCSCSDEAFQLPFQFRVCGRALLFRCLAALLQHCYFAQELSLPLSCPAVLLAFPSGQLLALPGDVLLHLQHPLLRLLVVLPDGVQLVLRAILLHLRRLQSLAQHDQLLAHRNLLLPNGAPLLHLHQQPAVLVLHLLGVHLGVFQALLHRLELPAQTHRLFSRAVPCHKRLRTLFTLKCRYLAVQLAVPASGADKLHSLQLPVMTVDEFDPGNLGVVEEDPDEESE
mmetsp:Transcript_36266/g.50364  ORF Transcript_36266/g.50364 Transcript_36266/m.50364 type:complete len:227 (-) Transcript_36266:212-892(-)